MHMVICLNNWIIESSSKKLYQNYDVLTPWRDEKIPLDVRVVMNMCNDRPFYFYIILRQYHTVVCECTHSQIVYKKCKFFISVRFPIGSTLFKRDMIVKLV
jgi:hypothetical protein